MANAPLAMVPGASNPAHSPIVSNSAPPHSRGFPPSFRAMSDIWDTMFFVLHSFGWAVTPRNVDLFLALLYQLRNRMPVVSMCAPMSRILDGVPNHREQALKGTLMLALHNQYNNTESPHHFNPDTIRVRAIRIDVVQVIYPMLILMCCIVCTYDRDGARDTTLAFLNYAQTTVISTKTDWVDMPLVVTRLTGHSLPVSFSLLAKNGLRMEEYIKNNEPIANIVKYFSPLLALIT